MHLKLLQNKQLKRTEATGDLISNKIGDKIKTKQKFRNIKKHRI